jgi:hypothetical protein
VSLAFNWKDSPPAQTCHIIYAWIESGLAGSMCSTLMRCLALTKNLRRCNRKGDWRLFCYDHSKQPLVWAGSLFTAFAGLVSILSYFGYGPIAVTKRGVEANSPRSASTPAILPSPKDSEKPIIKLPDKPNVVSGPRKAQPSRLRNARALFAQGKYQGALRECDTELRKNPHSNEALSLRKRITNTIKILNRQ